jgi:hypothetical protein
MPPTRNPDIECFDDDDPSITVWINPRLAEGYFVACCDGELLSWGRIGASPYPEDADAVHLNPADYARMKQLKAEREAERATDS